MPMFFDFRKAARPAPAHTSLKAAEAAQKSLAELFTSLDSCSDGLQESQAVARLETEGRNDVARERVPNVMVQLAGAFNNPFIYVLLLISAVSFYSDYWLPLGAGEETDGTSAAIVLFMVLLSGFMRFWQEYRSNKAAEALQAMVHTTAAVTRRNDDGQSETREIPLADLVPGDIVRLSAGDMVPADIRLIESRDLFVSQAALTGESLPVEKYDTLAAVAEKSAETAGEAAPSGRALDSGNMCFMGSNVVIGTATALVVATGANTYFGSLAKSIVGTRSQTAFDRGVNSVSWLLIRFMLCMVPIVFFINGFTKGDWSDAFMFSLAIAVGLTPEMLPMIVSANLAKGAVAMSRSKVVVKRLNSIQNFGAMDILCTDKTGTLTQDKIILERHVDALGNRDDDVLRLAWVNSYHQSGIKNLMDKAIVHFGEQHPENGLPRHMHKVDELPFDFVRRRLSVIVSDTSGEHLLVCKGAVEEMLSIASGVYVHGQVVPMDAQWRQKIIDLSEAYNRDGFRVLALGAKAIKGDDIRQQYTTEAEKDLIIRGFLTFLDPPKDSAESAIAALREHGVSVKVLTGDTPVITAKICHEVGLEPGTVITGDQIDAMNEQELLAAARDHDVFARLTPLQKSRIIKTLQQGGHTVGFLGDGINDAPGLRDADVGISVDSAADIAKESADIILLEKSLMVLEEGVVKGRETFGNIMKYLNMTASSNFGNVFSVLVASAFIPFLPMLPIQLLLQNLMYDFSQLSLPWDRVDKEFLQKPRKWDAKNIGRFMVWIGPTSSIFDITTYALMWFVFGATSVEMQSLFQSGWFVEGLLSQTLVVHMLRTRKIPFVQSTAALPVLLLTGTVMALGIYMPFSGLGELVGLEPLPWSYFPWLAGTLLCYCVVAQGMKVVYIRKFGRWF